MAIPNEIFRQYDIRGIVGEQLTAEVAHAVGRAVATVAFERVGRQPSIAVGRDNRPSGEMLGRAMRDGIAAAGGIGVDVGVLPTPALYLATHELEVDGGIQVTGSHNPPEFNGFKMVVAGATLHGDDITDLKRRIDEDDLRDAPGSLGANGTVLDKYAEAIVSRNGPIMRPLTAVVDCGNGVASVVAEKILSEVGANVIPLFCESDGTFPNHHPDPTVIENLVDLQETVRRTKADVGIAFDGDGDRIGIVDELGEVVFGDKLLALYGRDLAERTGKGHNVVFDVKCSDILAGDLEKSGLKPNMWKTGHSLIKAKMKELDAPLAGEMSGHMFFGGDYYGFDDAMFGAARLLAYLARRKEPVSVLLSDLPPRKSTPEIRVDWPEETKFAVVEKAVKYFGDKYVTDDVDGVRITFQDGWGLIRASNTQPVLVMRFEADTDEHLTEYRNEVENWLKGEGQG
ncbi:MAG: phosphomannomutase/phosphoglucomutase [Gemmatimonadota bacterium]|nr:phosphomannomutase/phosphoglucomutase [Gemmatimonadota bacterium]